jgi:hypothetical protein
MIHIFLMPYLKNNTSRNSLRINIVSFVTGVLVAGLVVGITLLLLPALLFGVAIVLHDSTAYFPLPLLQHVVTLLLHPLIYGLPLIQILLFLVGSLTVVRNMRWKGPYFLTGFLLLVIPIFILAVGIMTWDALERNYTGPIRINGIL